jgi:uncharacterized membrane protein YkvI
MLRIVLIIILVTQVGCSALVGYLIGTAGNLTSDLIMRELEEKEKEKKK